MMISCGIDVGSLSGEAVLMRDGEIISWSIVRTGPDSAATAQEALDEALKRADLQAADIHFTVSTGYGRIIVPFAQRNISEISCHAKGANFFFPSARTVLDMGGQDCKAIRCDHAGRVTAFMMNDKCAAGTGRAMEVIASLLQVKLEDIGPISMAFQGEPRRISNTCVVFARSEVLSLMREGVSMEEILAALCDGMTERIKGLVRRVGVEKDFVISGGIAKNVGIVARLEQALGLEARIPPEPQIVGAVGAALFAAELFLRPRAQPGPPPA